MYTYFHVAIPGLALRLYKQEPEKPVAAGRTAFKASYGAATGEKADAGRAEGNAGRGSGGPGLRKW